MRNNDIPEVWKNVRNIPNPKRNGWRYIVSNRGEIRIIYGNGKHRTIGNSEKSKNAKGSRGYRFMYRDQYGKRQERSVAAIVWEAFMGDVPDGMCIIHANGSKYDNSIVNLRCVSLKDVGHIYGCLSGRKGRWSKGCKYDHRRTIAHIDRNGNVLAFYRSSREAERAYRYLSFQSILDRCNRKIKRNLWLPDGTTFVWEDDIEKFQVKHESDT